MTALDRTPKPCLHKQASHEHGHRNAYVLDRCRCLPCCYAASVYEQERAKRNAYGRSNLIGAGPVRAHVTALMAAGVGLKRIVAVSGVPQGTLWKLIYGKNGGTPSKRVTRATADRLLALDPNDPSLLADGATITSPGTTRRLQALACLGWSVGRLATDSGMDRQRLDTALHGRPVVAGTARAVAHLYKRLWDQPAPATNQRERISAARATNRAKAAGWAPPLAWDDIDDPAAQPDLGSDEDTVDELAVDAVLDGHPMRLTGDTLLAAVERLMAGEYPVETAAARLRMTVTDYRRARDVVYTRRSRAAA